MGISDKEVFEFQHDVLGYMLNDTCDETVKRVAWLGEAGIASTVPRVRSTIEETFKLLPDSIHHLYDIENQAKKITSYDGVEVELVPWDIREDWDITGYDLVVMFRTSVHAKSKDHFLQQLELLVKNNRSVIVDITLYGGQLQCSYDHFALSAGPAAAGHEYFGEQGRDNPVYFDVRGLIPSESDVRSYPNWVYSSRPNHRNLLMSDGEMRQLFWNIPLSAHAEHDTITSDDIMSINDAVPDIALQFVTNGLIDREGMVHAKENRLGTYSTLDLLTTEEEPTPEIRDLLHTFEKEFEENLKNYNPRNYDNKIKLQLMAYLCWK